MADEDLRKYGYAPGNYIVRCHDCNSSQLWQDKRAWRCRSCAIIARENDVIDNLGKDI